MTLVSIALILFLIIDPLGKVSFFVTFLDGVKNPQKVVIQELLLALLLMLAFNLLGEVLFHALQLSQPTVQISSGIILFLVAIRILFPSPHRGDVESEEERPFLVPLAIPGIASPALLATIMLFAHMVPSTLMMTAALLVAWGAAAVVLLSAHRLQKLLGSNGLLACERLMAMILVLLSIQRFLDGVHTFVEGYVGG